MLTKNYSKVAMEARDNCVWGGRHEYRGGGYPKGIVGKSVSVSTKFTPSESLFTLDFEKARKMLINGYVLCNCM